jgi:hypothetical protein
LVRRKGILLRPVGKALRDIRDLALAKHDTVTVTHRARNRQTDLIEVVTVPRHVKIRILPPEDVHEIFRRAGLSLKHMLERDGTGRVVDLPIIVVERNDFHERLLR